MPHANRPAGPGKPVNEQHDAVTQQEGLDELQSNDEADGGRGGQPLPDPMTNARHAERGAHTKRDTNRKV
jgi:hypothetical protein